MEDNIFYHDNMQLLKWKLTDNMMGNVTCLMPHLSKAKMYDCVINSLNFVKQIDDPDVARFLAKLNNESTKELKGTRDTDLLELLFHKYKTDELKHKDTIMQLNIAEITYDWQSDLKEIIGDGYCTLFKITFTRALSGHALVAGVYKNQLMLIDPQQELYGSFDRMMEIYNSSETHGKVNSIECIYRNTNTKKRILHMTPFSKMKGRPTKSFKRTRILSSPRSSEKKIISPIFSAPLQPHSPKVSPHRRSSSHKRKRASSLLSSTSSSSNKRSTKRMRLSTNRSARR